MEMLKPFFPVPEKRPIHPLGARTAPAFPIASWEVRAEMLKGGRLVPVFETLPPERREQIPCVTDQLRSIYLWENDGGFYHFFINPKELIEEALLLNDATKALICGEADELTSWRILASPRLQQVMDTDTSIAKKFIDATELGPVSMGRALRAAEDFAADSSAAYHLITAFASGLSRTVNDRRGIPHNGQAMKRQVDIGDISPLLSLYQRISDVTPEWLRQSPVREAYSHLWSFSTGNPNRTYIRMSPTSEERLRVLAEGGG